MCIFSMLFGPAFNYRRRFDGHRETNKCIRYFDVVSRFGRCHRSTDRWCYVRCNAKLRLFLLFCRLIDYIVGNPMLSTENCK